MALLARGLSVIGELSRAMDELGKLTRVDDGTEPETSGSSSRKKNDHKAAFARVHVTHQTSIRRRASGDAAMAEQLAQMEPDWQAGHSTPLVQTVPYVGANRLKAAVAGHEQLRDRSKRMLKSRTISTEDYRQFCREASAIIASIAEYLEAHLEEEIVHVRSQQHSTMVSLDLRPIREAARAVDSAMTGEDHDKGDDGDGDDGGAALDRRRRRAMLAAQQVPGVVNDDDDDESEFDPLFSGLATPTAYQTPAESRSSSPPLDTDEDEKRVDAPEPSLMGWNQVVEE